MKTIDRFALVVMTVGICFYSFNLRADENLRAISEERQLWPSEVILNQIYKIELLQAGGGTGFIELPKGVKLKLRAVESDGLDVEFVGTRFKLQPSFTNFEARVAMKRKVFSISQMPSAVANEKTPGTPSPLPALTGVAAPVQGANPITKRVFAGLSPWKLCQFSAPLSEKNQKLAAKDANVKLKSANVGIYVPPNFKPDQIWPVLVVNATSQASSIGLAEEFAEDALNKGWVVIAADNPTKSEHDEETMRLAMILAGLEIMHAEWPGSKKWPIACGGFSGGAKYSGYVAAGLAHEGYRIIGMFMAGCNQDMATLGLKKFHPPVTEFKAVPIFLSSGNRDTVATPQNHQSVQASMKSAGFRQIRIESFDGEHRLYRDHIGMALDWFKDMAKK